MSANNFLLIRKNQNLNEDKFELFERQMEEGAEMIQLYSSNKLEKMIKKAQEYMKRHIVEYGVHFEI